MSRRRPPTAPASLSVFGMLVLTLALVLTGAPSVAALQQQPEEQSFAITGWVCPSGYDGVAYATDCTESLTDFAFDLAGPIDAEVTTDDDGLADFGEVPLAGYTVEALDFDPDKGFVVACNRPVPGGPFPVDIVYTDAGFEIDLAAEFEREVPDASDAEDDGVTCAWYALPDPAAEDRPGVFGIDNRVCEGVAEEPSMLAAEPGARVDEIAALRDGDCQPTPATVTLTNDETGEETAVEVTDDPEQGYTLAGVPPGTYTVTHETTDATAGVDVFAGETTVVLAVAPAAELTVTLEIGPTAAAEAVAEPLDPLAFDAGDWQNAFPNINTGVYDRAAVAVYGRLSDFPSASLRFDLPSAPVSDATLTIEGLDDELGPVTIAVTVNGDEIYQGESGFADWDPSAASPTWTPVSFTIPAGLLQAGENEITVANLADSDDFGLPPYVLLSTATLTFAE